MMTLKSLIGPLLTVAMVGCQSPVSGTPDPTPLADATATPESSPNTITICVSEEPHSLVFPSEGEGEWIAAVAMPPLFELGSAYNYTSRYIIGELPSFENGGATSYVDDRGNPAVSVIFAYRDDMRWSDGMPLSTDDFMLPYEIAFQVITDDAFFWSGADIYRAGTHSIRVDGPNLGRLSDAVPGPLNSWFFPMPAHRFQSDDLADAWYAYEALDPPDPVLGPYEYVEWVRGEQIVMQAVPDWWGGNVRTSYLVFRFVPDPADRIAAVVAGECDFATDVGTSVFPGDYIPVIQSLWEQGFLRYDSVASPVWEHLTMNTAPAPGADDDGYAFFADPRVRQAVAFGTDRQWMADNLMYGEVEPLDSVVPPEHWAYNPSVSGLYPFDPDRARELLEEAGWRDLDGDYYREAAFDLSGENLCGLRQWIIPSGTPFVVTFHSTNNNAMRSRLASEFAQDMREIGIRVNTELLSPSEWFADDGPLYQRTFQIGNFAWVTAGPEGESFSIFGGTNIYRTPQGEYRSALTIREEQLSLLTTERAWEIFALGGSEYYDDEWPTGFQIPLGYELERRSAIPSQELGNDGSQNYSGWCNAQASELLFNAERSIYQSAQSLLFRDFQRILMAEVPILPLFQRVEIDVYNPRLCGPGRGPLQPATWNVNTWYFSDDGECDR